MSERHVCERVSQFDFLLALVAGLVVLAGDFGLQILFDCVRVFAVRTGCFLGTGLFFLPEVTTAFLILFTGLGSLGVGGRLFISG